MGIIEVELKSSTPLDVNLGQGGITIRDYEKLYNKPQINNVTLIGNLFLNDIFPDGIIINGGDSTGYATSAVSPGDPYNEEMGF